MVFSVRTDDLQILTDFNRRVATILDDALRTSLISQNLHYDLGYSLTWVLPYEQTAFARRMIQAFQDSAMCSKQLEFQIPDSYTGQSLADSHQKESVFHAFLELRHTDMFAALTVILIMMVEQQIGILIDLDTPLMQAGLTSARGVKFVDTLSEFMGVNFEVLLIFNHPTVSQLALFVSETVDLEVALADSSQCPPDDLQLMFCRNKAAQCLPLCTNPELRLLPQSLSYEQEQWATLQLLQPKSSLFHLFARVSLEGISSSLIQSAVNTLV